MTGKALGADEFEFVLEKMDNNGDFQEIQRKKNDANGDIKFDKIEYREEGHFNYRIRELEGNLQDIIYDNSECFVQVIVKKLDNIWFADVYYGDDNNIPIFENRYEPKIDIEGKKTWNDALNQDNKRPTEIIIKLLKNNNEIQRKTVTEDQG